MSPLIDKTTLDAALIATARAAVTARRGGGGGATLSARAQATKDFLLEGGHAFCGEVLGSVERLASAMLGEDVSTGKAGGGMVGQVFVPTQTSYGYREGVPTLFVGNYGLMADGSVGQHVPEGTDVSGYARLATDAEVEAYFGALRMTDGSRTALGELAMNASGVRR